MSESLIAYKGNKQTILQPYTELKEYYIACIQDFDNEETQIWNSVPFSRNLISIHERRESEKEKARFKLRQIADFIKMTNDITANPYIYDIGDGNRLEVKLLNLYWVQSYYPPEAINAPLVKRQMCCNWRFWNGQLG